MSEQPRHIAHLHLHGVQDEAQYADALDLMTGLTPHVQAFPPDAVQLDLTSALRYFDRGPEGMVHLAAFRLMGLHGIKVSAGLAGNRMLAAMAAAVSEPGGTTQVRRDQAGVDAWLRPRPLTALPGVGRRIAETLGGYGLYTVGQVADLPPATLQRILGAAPARLLAERARGRDPRPVVPRAPAAHLSADHFFERDCLDPEEQHRAVLALAEDLGLRLRAEAQATGRLTLTVRCADRSSVARTCALSEATGHSPALAAVALGLLAGLGLQRARVRVLALRADGLLPAEDAHRQLSLDPGENRARAAEAAADRARGRFGPDAVYPATLAPLVRPPATPPAAPPTRST